MQLHENYGFINVTSPGKKSMGAQEASTFRFVFSVKNKIKIKKVIWYLWLITVLKL